MSRKNLAATAGSGRSAGDCHHPVHSRAAGL